MLSVPVSVQTSSPARSRSRTVLVASADRSFRQRISETLTGLRWQVREAEGGAPLRPAGSKAASKAARRSA